MAKSIHHAERAVCKSPILIIEDDLSIRSCLREILENEGYSVSTAENGKIGLEKIRKHPRPGLVFLDMMMPVMDGREFLDVVSEEENTSSIPVVVLSAVANETNTAGATSFLKKPIELERILEFAQVFCQ